ncbi:MAG: hypothetical protein WCK91_02050 [bacterium]
MNITIINDCRDANAVGRQVARTSSLIEGNISFVGVASDIEASGNLIDILDGYGDSKALVIVNVAPRNGKSKKWKNGTPFGYFWYKDILVVTSIEGYTLSLIKKFDLTPSINVMDIPTVMERFVQEGILSRELADQTINTQFRSYEFLPRVSAYLLENHDVVSEEYKIEEVADVPSAVWWVDCFGNCKTTLLKKEISQDTQTGEKFGEIKYYDRLKDVPDATCALITGSSGLGSDRFLEIVIQGKSASSACGLVSGDAVEFK